MTEPSFDPGHDSSDPYPTLRWSTEPVSVAAIATGGAVMAVLTALTITEPAGRFMVGAAALVLLGIAGLAAAIRPKLQIDDDRGGLQLRTIGGRQRYRRIELSRVRIVRYPRLGRRVPVLEIETTERAGDRLFILTRWDLGTDPHDVFDVLVDLGLVPGDRGDPGDPGDPGQSWPGGQDSGPGLPDVQDS